MKPMPIMRDNRGRIRTATDHYGDVECPFCDHVLAPENTPVILGDKCKRCSGEVIGFEPLFIHGQILDDKNQV